MTRSRLLLAAAALATAAQAVAHPLGNNSVNRQSALTVAPGTIELRYVMDLAEIPTLRASQEADRDQDGDTSPDEWQAHSLRWASEVSPRLSLKIDGKPLALSLRTHSFKFLPGEAGLVTLRLEAAYTAELSGTGTSARLEYRDDYQPGRSGWKEIFIRSAGGAGIEQASVPDADRSKGLTDYSLPLAAPAPNELAASARIRLAAAAATRSLPSAASAEPGKISAAKPVAIHPGAGSLWRQAWIFFKLGVHHIATGWDHLVFLFGLLLVSRSVLELIKVVTAFTLAHSLTLALAAAGLVTAPGAIIEPAIALTIAYVGLVGLLWRSSRHGVWLALLFGLVHGFGFAGALAESLSVELSTQASWLVSLASFNLGIEAFQVLLVCILVPLLACAARYSWSGAAARLASCAVLVAGLGWFFTRTIVAMH